MAVLVVRHLVTGTIQSLTWWLPIDNLRSA